MKPVPNSLMVVLVLSLCGLCGWQWMREVALREISNMERVELASALKQRDELESRVKAADTEILRLTGSLNEVRANSLSKEDHDAMTAENGKMREGIEKQNAVILEQNEKINQANVTIQQANDNIKKLNAERDSLAKKVNEVTALYNKLAKAGGQ